MGEARVAIANKPAWIDLASADPAGSRDFYSELFGWQIEVSPDPQFGGYAIARIAGEDVSGIGPKPSADAPSAWQLYIGTEDADSLASKAQAAGGKMIAPPFDVGDLGRMVVLQDPSGAFISAWQPKQMGGFRSGATNTFGWAELNARGIDSAIPFYERVFGWTVKSSEMGEGMPPYTEFQLGGQSIAGGMEMNPQLPAAIPSYWMVYFNVDDVDGSYTRAIKAGAQEMMAGQDFPGGRFAIARDPQGAVFGFLKMKG